MSAPPTRGTTYFTLIGDIVSSRDLTDRAGVQRRLGRALEDLNDAFRGSTAAPLKLIKGDEVQGLLREGEAVVDLMTGIGDAIHPARMVWGLGHGPLATDLTGDVDLLDGPCFHRAREALGRASLTGAWLATEGFPSPHGEAVSALMSLVGAIRSDWTETRLRYVIHARQGSQRDVAERFDVNESTVSRALARAHFARVVEGEAAARALLGSGFEEQGTPG